MASFTETAPASDDDPYSSSDTKGYHIDRNDFPRPLPIFGPLLGYDDKFFAKVTGLKIQRASQVIKRPLTSDEANAMAYWAAKQISILSYATPVGMAGGVYRWYSTMNTFRFPFYGPNMQTFNPYEFPNKMPLLTGPFAPRVWHFLRLLFYAGAGKFAAGLFFGSYAMSVAAVGEMGDKRLKDVQEVFQREVRSAQSGARPQPGFPQPTTKPAPVSSTGDDASMNSEVPYDDASPAGGMYFDEIKDTRKPSTDTYEAVQEEKQPSPQPRRGRWPQAAPESPAKDDSPFLPWDDDSPTGGQGMQGNNSIAQQPVGSAWERIRSGQKPVPSRQNQNNQRDREKSWSEQQNSARRVNPNDDEFSATSSQEARRYSREEAQREFDAKIERERRGGDFVSGSGDQKRW